MAMSDEDERRESLRRRSDIVMTRAAPGYRKVAIGSIVCWAIVATLASVALYIQSGKDTSALNKASRAVEKADAAVEKANRALATSRAIEAKQHSQLIQGCERLNVQRATANNAYAGSFSVFSFVYRFTQPTKAETPRQRQITARFIGKLHQAVVSEQWTPLTDCRVAISNQGYTYKAPQPVSFSKRLPPASAMSAANARLATPVDSIP